jgi:hypothetical protein
VPIPHTNRRPAADFDARQKAFRGHLQLESPPDDEAIVVFVGETHRVSSP